MAEFRMPSLGADMEAGTLVEWKVKPGDTVVRGQVVAVVETDKGAIEVETWEAGEVRQIRVEEGERVPVGTVLAVLGAPGEPAEAPAVAGEAPASPAPGGRPEGAGREAEPPRPPAGGAEDRGERRRATPAARARARELGVDLASVAGTGPGGAVVLSDLERGPARAAAAPPPAGSPPATAAMRRAIGAAMARSKREILHYYLSTEIDLSRALAWLARENEGRAVTERMLPAVLLLKAVALAAREVPEVNGFFVDGAFRPAEAVHLGVAVSLRQGGLVAPALHEADRKPLADLMRDLSDLVLRARSGRLRSSDLADPTLTVTSLGDLGVSAVFGIITPPQVALVGFGRIGERPLAVGGRVEARAAVVATLSGDHRVSDGMRGAQFLAGVARRLQEPETL